MFKKVETKEFEKSEKSEKNNKFYKIKKYRITYCTDMNDIETKIEELIDEREVMQEKCEIIRTERIEELSLDKNELTVKEILTYGLLRIVRNIKKVKIYEINIYNVGDKEIKGDKLYKGCKWVLEEKNK